MCGKPKGQIPVVVEVNGQPLHKAIEMAETDLCNMVDNIDERKRLIVYTNTLIEIEEVLCRHFSRISLL